ncbi:hypothetical protein GCM10026986_26490 [Nitrincola alkalisediminis]
MYTLDCTDKFGTQRTFTYNSDEDTLRHETTYTVYSDPMPPSNEFFQLTVKEVGGELQIIAMYHNREPAYIAKGIPEALIVDIVRNTGKTVRSSPVQGNPGEFRTCDATKVWDRLVSKGQATYSQNEDVYRTS